MRKDMNQNNQEVVLKKSIKVFPVNDLQELLKDKYDFALKVGAIAHDEWQKPQDEEDANDTLIKMGISYGIKSVCVEISKFLNENTISNNKQVETKEEKKEQTIEGCEEQIYEIAKNFFESIGIEVSED